MTAVASKTKQRTAESFVAHYGGQANAQTGDRYTVAAGVFPANRLDAELTDAAARMSDLRVTDEDVTREKQRLLEEVDNMFAAFPPLAASNNARELVRPTPRGGRRGGQAERVRAMTIQEIQARCQRYYKPKNATLVLAGAIDSKTVRNHIADHFGKLPPGEPIPDAASPGPPKFGGVQTVRVRSEVPDAKSMACLGYLPPQPDSDLYAPFLVLITRLWEAGSGLGASDPDGAKSTTRLSTTGESSPYRPRPRRPKSPKRLLRGSMRSWPRQPGRNSDQLSSSRRAQQVGFLLGISDIPDNLLGQNLYGVAFSLGRREQLGIDPAALGRAWDAVSNDAMRRAAAEVFAPAKAVRVFVEVEK